MEATEITIRLPRPHAQQLRLRDSKAKRKVVCAGRRGGKTTGMAILAVEALLAGRRVLEAAPVADQTDAFWQACCAALVEPIATGLIRKNETNRVLELMTEPSRPSGSQVMPRLPRIRCKTAHDADSLRGDYADLLILDEYALMDESAWTQVGAPMLLDNNGDAVFVFTPKSMNHAHTLYQRAIGDDTGRWEAFHFTSLDNPHLSAEALAEITQDLTQDDYQQEILARFLQGSGCVFRNIDQVLIAPATSPAEHRGHLVVGGVDWGQRSDFTCASVFCCNCGYEVALDRFNGLPWALQRDRLLQLLVRWNVKFARVETNSIGGPNLEALGDAAPQSLSLIGFTMTQKSKPPLIQKLALCFETASAMWLPDDIAKHELLAFEAEALPSGYVRYGAPSGGHDDTIIARALCWRTAEANMPVGFTEAEKKERLLPANLRRDSLDQLPQGAARDIAEFMREVKLSDRKKEQRADEDNWTSEIVDPSDDVWEGAYKNPEGW